MTNFDLRDACSDDAPDIQAIYAPIVEETAISFEIVAPSVEEMSDRIQAYSLSHAYRVAVRDRKSTRLNSSHSQQSRMPSSA